MCNVVLNSADYNVDMEGYIESFVEIFNIIDTKGKGSICFQQLTNFIIDIQEIMGRDESLFETCLKLCESNMDSYDHTSIEKVYDFQDTDFFGILEANMKNLRLINARTLLQDHQIEFESTTFTCATYMNYKHTLALCSNDKNISFYDILTHKIVRKLPVPDAQIHIEYSVLKNTLYTSNSQGIICAWNVERIFSKAFESQYINKKSFEKALKQEPFREQIDVTCMLNIESLGMLATGSNDTNIRLYNNQRSLSSSFKLLCGHIKGIKGICYNEVNKYIISCSFDFEVLIWNAYLDHPVARLVGHDAPLVSVISPKSNSNVIISVDAKGLIKLWNTSTFNEVQTINADDDQLRLFEQNSKKNQTAIPESTERSKNVNKKQGNFLYKVAVFRELENKLIIGQKKLSFYEFDKSFNPQLADDKQVLCMAYSSLNCEFYTGAGRSVRVWNFRKGNVQRVYKNISDSEITCMSIDAKQRKLYLGQNDGKIRCIDCLTGFKVKDLNYHTKEICFLTLSVKNSLLISAGWDQTVRIICDERVEKNEEKPCLRVIRNASKSDISAASFSENLQQIATVSRDNCIRLWDFEKGNFLYRIPFPSSVTDITMIRILDPFPLIACSDNSGFIYIWGLKQSEQLSCRLIIKWKNMFTIQKASVITAMDHQCSLNPSNLTLELILGDEIGYLRFLNLNELLSEFSIKPFVPPEENRNFKRTIDYVFTELESDIIIQREEKPLLLEKKAKQVLQWKAHKEPIKVIQQIQDTIETTYITIGMDCLIKLWNSSGQCLADFKQGGSLNYQIQFKPFYQDGISIKTAEVKQYYDQVLKTQRKNKKTQSVPFSKPDSFEQMKYLIRVESSDVFQQLQDIEKYLEKDDYKKKTNDNQPWRQNMDMKKLSQSRKKKIIEQKE